MTARIQADALSEIPAGISAEMRPTSDGLRRLAHSLRPVADSDHDVIHSLDIDLPLRATAPTVTTVHDLSVFDVPWAFDGLRARAERRLVSHFVRSADAVIAVSQFTAEAVLDRFGRTATVTHLAPSPDMVPPSDSELESVVRRYQLPDRFALHVGTIEPRKDVPRLIDACRMVDLPLVLAGAGELSDQDAADSVRLLGYVPRHDLPALYSSASVVAYPSVYEGFGLPPVEAMACGAAVVATEVGALPEIVGSRLGLCSVGDTEALAEALRAAADDPRHNAELRAAGAEIASSLSWGSTAAITLGVYRSLGAAA